MELCVTHRFNSLRSVVNIYSLAESSFALNEPLALKHKYMMHFTTSTQRTCQAEPFRDDCYPPPSPAADELLSDAFMGMSSTFAHLLLSLDCKMECTLLFEMLLAAIKCEASL